MRLNAFVGRLIFHSFMVYNRPSFEIPWRWSCVLMTGDKGLELSFN